jgi:hypothetical protein
MRAALKTAVNLALGQQIAVFTDHKNMTHANFNTDCAMRWQLVLEEFGPDLQCIKGKNNIVADALSSCLDTDNNQEIFNISKCFGYDDDNLPPSSYPTRHKDIAKAQLDNPASQTKLKNHKAHNKITFCGGNKDYKLICRDGKIALPLSLQQKTTDWHHEMLCHPGTAITKATARQHFDWKGLRTMVIATCKKCLNCQLAKPTNQKHGKLPAKAAEENPWDTFVKLKENSKHKVEHAGPYKITQVNDNGTVRFQ